MRRINVAALAVTIACAVLLQPTIAEAQTTKKAAKAKRATKPTISSSEAKLPEPVRKTFDDNFPNAKIEQSESEEENGVTVYDIEFREGRTHKETDIAADGTMIEMTIMVSKNSVPKEALKPMTAAAKEKDAKMGRVEKIEITHELKSGKVVKLDKPKTQYAVEMTKDDQMAEIVVDDSGKVVEEPKWEAKPTAKAEKAKSAA